MRSKLNEIHKMYDDYYNTSCMRTPENEWEIESKTHSNCNESPNDGAPLPGAPRATDNLVCFGKCPGRLAKAGNARGYPDVAAS